MNDKGIANIRRIEQQNAAEIRALQAGTVPSRYRFKPAAEINPAIARLPTAQLVELEASNNPTYDKELLKDFKGVKVTDSAGKSEYVQVCGKDYKIVQHAEAFRPIIEGLTVAGNDSFHFTLTSNHRHAELRIFTGNFGYDGVTVGWRVFNSFTGHSTLNYGLDVDRHNKTIELVGYRQSCQNGAVIKVPLEDAEVILPEVQDKIEKLIADAKAFKHTGGVMQRLEGMQYIAEAIALLQQPIEAMIKKAQKSIISTEDKKKLKQLINLHVGKRYAAKVLEQFNREDSDAWGLYNAITYVASHDNEITDSGRALLEDKAANLLLAEVRGR